MKSKRNGTIDVLKFAFTVMVMLFHTSKFFIGGYIAVDFFFIVSGFLMAKSMQKTLNNGVPLGIDTVRFVLKKAKGIFPYYISAWLISFVATVSIKSISAFEGFTTLLKSFYNITMTEMVGNYDMGHRVQASWYISAMLIGIFLLYPIRKRFTDVFDHIIAPALFLLFVGMAYQSGSGVSTFTVGYNGDLFVYNGLIRGMAEIALGCVCFRLCNRIQQVRFTKLGGAMLSILVWVGFGLVFYFAFVMTSTEMDLALIPILAISIIIAFSEKSLIDKVFVGKFFSVLGTFSLQLYLTHELVKNIIIPHIRNVFDIQLSINENTASYLCVYFLLTLFAALLCNFMGKMFIKASNRLFPKIKAKLVCNK